MRRPLAYARGTVPACPIKILIDGFGEKDKIAAASIYKQFGNDVGILIAGWGPMAIPKSASSSRQKGAQILIADENPATLEFFSRLLEDNGFTTLTADSGEAVLRLLIGAITLDESWEPDGRRVIMRPLRRPIRVILIGDLMKPPIDGLDLIRRLRPYHIPIVVATSYGADYALLAKMAGAKVIIHKFADPTYVITTIEEALQERLFPRIPPR
jgi:CheY-like chemotaxis protein